MTQPGVMPHPWWQFWQIADFLIMLTVVVFFVRFVRRSDAGSQAEPSAHVDDEAGAHGESAGDPAGPHHEDGAST